MDSDSHRALKLSVLAVFMWLKLKQVLPLATCQCYIALSAIPMPPRFGHWRPVSKSKTLCVINLPSRHQYHCGDRRRCLTRGVEELYKKVMRRIDITLRPTNCGFDNLSTAAQPRVSQLGLGLTLGTGHCALKTGVQRTISYLTLNIASFLF